MLTNCKTIHSDIHSCNFIHSCIAIENINSFKIMLFAKHIVVGIVSRCYLQTSGTKLNLYISVFNYRNNTINKGNNYFFALQPLIFRVFRVNTHCSITHNCLRTCCCNHSITTTISITMNNFFFASGFTETIVLCYIVF